MVIFSFSSNQAESAANTDSRLIMSVAAVGEVYFCPMICKVYATPHDMIPVYNIVYLAAKIFDKCGVSKVNIPIIIIIPAVKN